MRGITFGFIPSATFWTFFRHAKNILEGGPFCKGNLLSLHDGYTPSTIAGQ